MQSLQTVQRPLRLLILEDDKGAAENLATLLRQHGHTSVIAGDGGSGLRLLQEQPGQFDGAIVDLWLPMKNGWEFIEEMDTLSDKGWIKKVPLIVTSGYDEVHPPSDTHHIPVLHKPFFFKDLLELVERNFQKTT